MLIRLFTENKNYPDICKIVSSHFNRFTIIKAEGYWQGNAEHSLIIEIDLPCNNYKNHEAVDWAIEQKIEQLIYGIKQLNKQDKILVQYIQAESKLL